MKTRQQAFDQIKDGTFDVCVIGGGSSGASCALDAQLRGLKTVVVDAGDFASGSSTASSKMVHGGVRYLAQGRLGLVRTKTILAHGTEEPAAFLKKITYLQHLAPWHLEECRTAGVWKPTRIPPGPWMTPGLTLMPVAATVVVTRAA